MTKLIRFFSAFFAATLLASTMGFAADLQAGRDYTQIESPLSTARDKIEVVEFFSYGCPHCNDFHPLLDAWAASRNSETRKACISAGFYFPSAHTFTHATPYIRGRISLAARSWRLHQKRQASRLRYRVTD